MIWVTGNAWQDGFSASGVGLMGAPDASCCAKPGAGGSRRGALQRVRAASHHHSKLGENTVVSALEPAIRPGDREDLPRLINSPSNHAPGDHLSISAHVRLWATSNRVACTLTLSTHSARCGKPHATARPNPIPQSPGRVILTERPDTPSS